MLLLLVYEVCLPDLAQVVAVSGNESRIIVERVSRRQNGDIYYFNDGSNMRCGDNTYLISECQCVKDQELFKSNDF